MDNVTQDIAVDDIQDDDSAYGEGFYEDDTQTLSSSAVKYRWEHGRRYHAYGSAQYWGPNDQKQLDAEDFVHSMFLTILDGKLYLAPLRQDLHRVLDLGCGTGIWTIEFATDHPSAEVIGIDLSPVQPSLVPNNCRFDVDDFNLDWTFPADHFDYIHLRMLTGSMSSLPEMHAKVFSHLAPGGWVEQMELSIYTRSDDGTVTPDMPFKRWEEVFREVGRRIAKTFEACEQAKDAIVGAGFVNVQERRLKIPIGRWPRDERLKIWGIFNRLFLNDAMEGFGLRAMTGILGWSLEETQVFLGDMRRYLKDPNIHGYIELCIVYGQKPPA